MKIIIIVAILNLSAFGVFASSDNVHLDRANTDIFDEKSLQNGAKLFMDYCASCHSISFMRYNRIGKDLNISDADVKKNLIFGDAQIGSLITSTIVDKDAQKWFGAAPPDLSLVARSKGVDWIYTYLRSFEADPTTPFGVNNTLLPNLSMPDVLWSLKAHQSTDKFDQDVRDITNFLDYVSEPAKLIRAALGVKVLLFLLVLLVLSYLLKKEYWRDVKYGKWRAKN